MGAVELAEPWLPLGRQVLIERALMNSDRNLPQTVVLGTDALGEVLTLQRAAFAIEVMESYPGYTAPVTQTLVELQTEMSAEGATILGIRDGHRLIAAIRMRPLDAKTMFLSRLSVAPDRVREGLGDRLLSEAVEHIGRNHPHISRVEFTADGANPWITNWYERRGFVIVQRGTENSPYEWRLAKEMPAR